MSNDLRPSVRATYDSRQTGPRYNITTWVDDSLIGFKKPIADPFVRQRVTLGRRDLLRGLFRGCLRVEVTVSADPELMNDVLELDENTLIPGRTRSAAFKQSINAKLGDLKENPDV